jgi:hypothetical protein
MTLQSFQWESTLNARVAFGEFSVRFRVVIVFPSVDRDMDVPKKQRQHTDLLPSVKSDG